jgi:hypothetical protein
MDLCQHPVGPVSATAIGSQDAPFRAVSGGICSARALAPHRRRSIAGLAKPAA